MENYIRAGMHLQQRKIGLSEKEQKKIIESFIGHSDYEEVKAFNIVGLDLDKLQNQAVHAIQVLLSRTNYEGNLEPELSIIDGFGTVIRPVIQFSLAEYYDACVLTKHKTSKGYNQYRGGDCKQALEALRSLYHKQFVISFKYRDYLEKKNKYISGKIENYSSLINSATENKRLDANNKEYLASITLELSSIFVFQLETYNVLKPIDYIAQIKQQDPYASETVHRLIEHVLFQSRVNCKNGAVKLRVETLANQLRMENAIRHKKWKEIRKVITRGLEVAKAIEFITDFKLTDKLVEYQINYDKLVKVENKYK
jgi:hypothetical protein